MARNKNPANRISLLAMPDKNQTELYFWYNGNPFRLTENNAAIIAFDGQVYYTEPVQHEAKQLVEAMQGISSAIGYLIAKKDLMMVGVETTRWNQSSYELLRFFPSNRSVVHRVKDRRMRIAGTAGIGNRINRVRSAEGSFAIKGLADIMLRTPQPHTGGLFS